jgi:hypothetical protein
MSKMRLALALTAALCVGAVGDAHAWVQFCNGTNATIWTTYSWYQPACVAEDGSTWEKAGWWSLAPGQSGCPGRRPGLPQIRTCRFPASGSSSTGSLRTVKRRQP